MRECRVILDRTHRSASGTIGNVLEWYDFAVFGYMAPLMSGQFFPDSDKNSALLKTFGVFAVGYFARPLGGMLFGQIGDRRGRKRALQFSVATMAIPTSLIMVLPTYAQVGLLSPFLLIVLRLAQGISAGGEFIGSSTYLVEVAPPGRRTSSGSWTFLGVMLGMLCGSAIAGLVPHLLTQEQIDAWGWRTPFSGGLLIGVIGWRMRREMDETADFVEMQRAGETQRWPVLQALRETPLQVVQVVGISLLFGVGAYTFFIWMPTYLTRFVKPPVSNALLINSAAMALVLLLTPLAGRVGDRLGYRKVLAAGTLGTALAVYPLFRWIDGGSPASVVVSMTVFALLISTVQGTLAVAMAERFPPRLRYSGTAGGYNLMFALFGGTTPLVATWLITKTGDLTAPAWYVTFAALVSLMCTLSIQPKRMA